MRGPEKRCFKRYPMELRGYAIINGSNIDLRTRDVSQGGGLVKFSTHMVLKKGTRLLVRFDIGVMGRAVVGRSVHVDNGTLYSIMFDRFDSYSDLILLAYLIKYEKHQPAGPALH